MPVTCISQNRTLTAHITGEVDHHGAKEIMATMEYQIDAAMPTQLTLDLSGVTFMDSSGIAVLLKAWRRMGELEGIMLVTGTPAQAARVLKAAGLERLMKFQ